MKREGGDEWREEKMMNETDEGYRNQRSEKKMKKLRVFEPFLHP